MVARKPVVLLDIDDTLLDFHKAEATAVARCFRELGIPDTPEVITRYSQINKSQWELMEEGVITRDQVLLRRFELLFAELGVQASGELARDTYEAYLAVGHWFMPEAEELLDTLYGNYDLYIASNGTGAVQAGRIASAGIEHYFKEIFISEDIGANKPEKAFFDRCFARIPGFDRERCIIVGDGLGSDIRGGINAGIRTCWYNPKGRPGREDIRADHEIRRLMELPKLLKEIWSD